MQRYVSLAFRLLSFGTVAQGCAQPSVAADGGQPFERGTGSGSADTIEIAERADVEALARLSSWNALPRLGTNLFYFKDSPKATPFGQNWGSQPGALLQAPGQVSFCRWQVLGNELDFQLSFEAVFEIALRDASVVELHRTLAFLYLQ